MKKKRKNKQTNKKLKIIVSAATSLLVAPNAI